VDPERIAVNCLAYNHNGSMMAAGGSDGMIRIYDMSSCSPIMGWNAHEGEVISIQFSYDETSVFSMGSDNKISEWSIHRILL
jgi:WD40 repeat protein